MHQDDIKIKKHVTSEYYGKYLCMSSTKKNFIIMRL